MREPNRGAGVTVRDVLRRYGMTSVSRRLYLALRGVVLPFDRIEHHVPTRGKVIEVCCGYGALAMLVALRSQDRDVLGTDIDEHRIAVAHAAAAGIANLEFQVGDVRSMDAAGAQSVLLIDALHYFEPMEQQRILRSLHAALVDGGTLILRGAMREFHPRYWWTWIHERIMVALSLTMTAARRVHFLTLSQQLAQLRDAGFKVEGVERAHPLVPYSDRIFVARAHSPGTE